MKWFNHPCANIILGIALFFAIHGSYLTFDGLTDDLGRADAIVVLGNKVEISGTPSKRLKSRLDCAFELYQRGYSQTIIVSGGLGKEGYEEADVMKEYLMSKGISDEHLIEDRTGYNTRKSAVAFKRIAEKQGLDSVILVSQYYHLTRAKLAFRQAGIPKIFSAHAKMAPELRDLYSIPREVVAFYFYLLRI